MSFLLLAIQLNLHATKCFLYYLIVHIYIIISAKVAFIKYLWNMFWLLVFNALNLAFNQVLKN